MLSTIVNIVANKLLLVPMIAGLLYSAKCAYDNDLIKKGEEKERRATIERVKEEGGEKRDCR